MIRSLLNKEMFYSFIIRLQRMSAIEDPVNELLL